MESGSQSEALLPKETKSSHKILYDSHHKIFPMLSLASWLEPSTPLTLTSAMSKQASVFSSEDSIVKPLNLAHITENSTGIANENLFFYIINVGI